MRASAVRQLLRFCLNARFLALFFANFVSAGSAHAYETEMLQSSGPSENRLDLVILGDGYTQAQQGQMKQDAQALVSRFWEQPVLSRYREFFNIKLVHVVSNQSGADNGSAGGQRDTALGAYFNCAGIDRLLCINDDAVNTVAFNDAPEADQVLVIVNDTKYGGSGGPIAVSSAAPSALDVPVHEIGHSLFGLADEYEYGGNTHPGECSEPNVTVNSNLNTVKWNYWNDLPGVGLVQGAHYNATGHYRPTADCMMRSLGVAMCPICGETTVVGLYDYVKLVEGQVPEQGKLVSFSVLDSQTFSVNGPLPKPSSLHYRWVLGSALLAEGNSPSVTLSGSDFGEGSHTLDVFIEDTTDWVRKDVGDTLSASASFPVDVVPAPEATGGGDPGASTGGQGSGGEHQGQATGGTSIASGGLPGAGGTTLPQQSTGGAFTTPDAPRTPPEERNRGCGCRTVNGGSPSGVGLGFLALFALGVGLRRRNTISR